MAALLRSRTLPWLLFAVALLLALVQALVPAPEPPSQPEADSSPAAGSTPVQNPSPPPELGLLRMCRQRLARLEAATPARLNPLPGKDACLDTPELRALIEQSVAERVDAALRVGGGAGKGAQKPPDDPNRADRMKLGTQLMSRVLLATPQDQVWLREVVCLVQDMRSHMLDELSPMLEDLQRPASDIDAITARLEQARSVALTDLETKLGKERYTRLRGLGGLGLLGELVDCKQ